MRRIDKPTTLAEIKRMLKKADRVAYMKLPKAERDKHLSAFKKCSHSEKEMPTKGEISLDLAQFSFLFQLIESSLDNKSEAENFAVPIARLLSGLLLNTEAGLCLVRPRASMLVFDPAIPALGPIGGPGEEEEEDG